MENLTKAEMQEINGGDATTYGAGAILGAYVGFVYKSVVSIFTK